jgi:hypothetical protein
MDNTITTDVTDADLIVAETTEEPTESNHVKTIALAATAVTGIVLHMVARRKLRQFVEAQIKAVVETEVAEGEVIDAPIKTEA